jgi:hypothetical protein
MTIKGAIQQIEWHAALHPDSIDVVNNIPITAK